MTKLFIDESATGYEWDSVVMTTNLPFGNYAEIHSGERITADCRREGNP